MLPRSLLFYLYSRPSDVSLSNLYVTRCAFHSSNSNCGFFLSYMHAIVQRGRSRLELLPHVSSSPLSRVRGRVAVSLCRRAVLFPSTRSVASICSYISSYRSSTSVHFPLKSNLSRTMASSSSSNDAVRDAVEGVTQGDVPPTGAAAAAGAAGGGRDKSRLIAESGSRIAQIGHIGGEFKRQKEPNFLRTRAAKFEALYEAQQTTLQGRASAVLAVAPRI